ncbi:Interference hedgehog-like protein [Dinothrombium tinctorium]|uniref:Interference hedgehog-like protein n=1 Tax=Dinothrombium tinctorium TaxID=1965070 RepID=A0A3S3PXM9_9ACAR|nr:Interference hedgehog-like protein [Dinothrombium tinctorium]
MSRRDHRCPLLVLLLLWLSDSVKMRKHGDPSMQHPSLKFTTQPTSKYVFPDGGKYVMKCDAVPAAAEIGWLLDGRPLLETWFARYVRISRNALTIKLPKNALNDGSLDATALKNVAFQCVASHKHAAIISQPAKLLIATLHPFPSSMANATISLLEGNTAVIHCSPPFAVPNVVTEFAFNGTIIDKSRGKQYRYQLMPSGNLHILSTKLSDSGYYKCISHNPFLKKKQNATNIIHLQVKKFSAKSSEKSPQFVVKPKSHINAILGTNVTFECVANGSPVPTITWSKLKSDLPRNKYVIVSGNLILIEAKRSDEGTYVCEASSPGFEKISATSILSVHEVPQITSISEDTNVVDGEDLRLMCSAKGKPKPLITWTLNGNRVADENIFNTVQHGNELSTLIIRNVNNENSGIYQCFATNELDSTYAYVRVSVADLKYKTSPASKGNEGDFPSESDNDFDTNNSDGIGNEDDLVDIQVGKKRKNKGIKMIPPSRPEISRLADDSVMVRWNVPNNDGLPIMFFKVQYKEVGRNHWMTVDADIAPHIHSYAVSGLKTGATYRFRIAAVYSNNDNKLGKTSQKFTLLKDPPIKKPNFPPKIIHAAAVSPSAILIDWDYSDNEDVKTEGFFIHYRASDTASDYFKITVEGSTTRSHVISHLLPDTTYDIKMQCFNVAGTSSFSNIFMSKTEKSKTESKSDNDESNSIGQNTPPIPVTSRDDRTLYCVIAIAFVAVVLVFIVYIILCIVRHKQQNASEASNTNKLKKNRQTEASDCNYLNGGHKSDYQYSNFHKSNGHLSNGISEKSLNGFFCQHHEEALHGSSERINIRSNPLCDRSQAMSTAALYTGNGKHAFSENNRLTSSASQASLHNTLEKRKGGYVDERYPTFFTPARINGRVSSFSRLNGTLERKRKSRTDLVSAVDGKECEPMLNRCNGAATTASANGPIVIMQSSC